MSTPYRDKRKEKDISFSFPFDANSNEKEINIDTFLNPLKSILESIHDIPQKMNISNTSDGFACACPYCGDSHTDKNAKRGNFYMDSLYYHCYNCGKHIPIDIFFKNFSTLCEIDLANLKRIKYYRTQLQAQLSKNSYEFLNKKVTGKYSIDINTLKQSFNYIDIWGTPGQEYLETVRKQTDLTGYLYDPKYNNIIILNLDKNNKVLALQIRKIKTKQYFSFNLKKIYEKMNIELPESDEFEKVNKYSTIFGLTNINFNNTVTVFEGVFDMKLYYNSISLSTANRELPFDLEGIQFWLDKDKTGLTKSINRIKKGYKVFLWNKYLTENCPDLLSHSKVDLNKLMIYCDEHKFKMKPFEEYFSNDPLDTINI